MPKPSRSKLPYAKSELFTNNRQPSYAGDATEVAFLLGGIGTGNFSIGARGEFRDFELFNGPFKGNTLPYTFASIWAKPKGEAPVARVLESQLAPPHNGAQGYLFHTAAGMPRLARSKLRGEYPFVEVTFSDDELPVKVELEAFTPFVPLAVDDSSLPAAILRYRVKNPSKKPVEVAVALSLANVVGIHPKLKPWGGLDVEKPTKNELRKEREFEGVFCTSPELSPTFRTFGNMAFAVTATGSECIHKTEWLSGGWWDGIHDFWDDFSDDGRLEPNPTYGKLDIKSTQKVKNGSVGAHFTLGPHEEKTVQFVVAWHFPNRPNRWEPDDVLDDPKAEWAHNHYTQRFADAWQVIQHVHEHLPRLEKASRDFHRALFSSNLPGYVVASLANNITVLRSPTCFRLGNGTFCGWEGVLDGIGSCFGNCTHVYNYAQTLAFLFPELELNMRQTEFGLETDETGKMAFRTTRIFGKPAWDGHPAADGQNGAIVRLYREWKLTGDGETLKRLWPNVVRALEFSFTRWDSDGDLVLDSQQHNTYDIEFYGPNSLVNSMFYAALKVGIELAKYLGDAAHAEKWQRALDAGSQRMDELLWGGEYYEQKLDDVDAYRYQYGKGCLSDQIIGQFMAHMVGLGYVLPEKHVKRALRSIFEHNFKTSLASHHNVQRTYALGDEAGLVLCSWPKGGRPRFPMVYADEVWSGIEAQVAAHLIFEGFLEEGLCLIKAVRDRHDGYRRNPWDEFECGHHYARSMASWAALIALSGFEYDMARGTLSFSPKINGDQFSCFFSTGKAWGTYRQKRRKKGRGFERSIQVLYGDLTGISVTADGESVPVHSIL
jgi:non-lysosomal glucosylceramidase